MAEFTDQPATTAGGVGPRISDTDWMCTDVACGNINFARRTTCNRCNKERADLKFMSKKKLTTEIGKSAADKSRGLFSADDWQCNKCANVNWARRQTCNVCNAPKFGEVEARTGYGGGYNERGTVEYRPRRDSDEDEYDEFGRRKKRKGRDRDPAGAHSSDKVGAAPEMGRKRSLSESSNLPVPTAARRTLKWIRGLTEEGIPRPDANPDSDLGDDAGPVRRPVVRPCVNPDGRSDAVAALQSDVKIHAPDNFAPEAVFAVRPDARINAPVIVKVPIKQSFRIADAALHHPGGGAMHRGIGREFNFNPRRDALSNIRPAARSHPRYPYNHFNGAYVKPRVRTLSRTESLETVGGECSKFVSDRRDRPLSGNRSADNKKILSGRDSVDSSAPLPAVDKCPIPSGARNREYTRYRNPSFERGQYISLEKNPGRCNVARDSIMENQVSSTNEIKYHFKGRTVDQSFEVTYSLEERVWAAACAIAHRSCKAAADMFQSAYDKPAPDFKTVFAWRQRLLTTGCLVDSHIPKDDPRQPVNVSEKIGKRWRLRKKRFYMHPKESSDTSEDDLVNFKRKSLPRKSEYPQEEIIIINSPDSDGVDKNKDSTAREKYVSPKENVDAVSAYRSSSSQMTRINLNEKRKSTDCPLTDGTRSITPELMTTRMDLARFGSLIKPVSPPMTFHDDIYFEGDAPQRNSENNQEPDDPARFVVPDIPKLTTKAVRSLNVSNDCINKSYLEDIMSESELHSSDVQSENDSCDRAVSERNPNSDKSAASASPVPPISNDISDEGPSDIFLKSDIVDAVRNDENNRYSPSKVAQQNTGIANTESDKLSDNIKYDEQQSGCAKNFSSAMRRIYERMSTEEKEKGGEIESSLEYVPTKIDPAMAKRNHQMFKSDNIMIESIHDIWPDNSSSKGSIGKEILSNDTATKEENASKGNPVKSINTASLFADYLPDEDALYRDASNEAFSDNLKTPPIAPIIGSISQYSAHIDELHEPAAHNPDDSVKSVVAESLNTLVNFNFATVNAEQLALALKNIQDMLVSKEILDKTIDEAEQNSQIINVDRDVAKESQTVDENKTQSSDADNKNSNIPFLDDMFYPGSPIIHGSQETGNTADDRSPHTLKSVDFSPDVNLDDMLECPMQAKKPISISGFQSFAIPKPIMLNRLKSLTRLKEASNAVAENNDSNMKTDVKIKRKRKRVKSNDADKNELERERDEEDEEESGDDEDLSKYDLCGSEDENDDQQKKTDAGGNVESSSLSNKSAPEKNDNQRNEKSRSPVRNQGGDQPRKRSPDDSGSSSSRRSSSSSSSSSASSSGRPPKNRYDDFNLNSEHSRAGSREDSPNNRSRSPIYPSPVDNNRSRNSNDKRRSSRSRSRDNKTKTRISNQDGVTRDKGRSRESNRDRDNRDRIKGGRDSRDVRRPHHGQNQNHTQNQRYHHHPRGRGRGGNQMRRMW